MLNWGGGDTEAGSQGPVQLKCPAALGNPSELGSLVVDLPNSGLLRQDGGRSCLLKQSLTSKMKRKYSTELLKDGNGT